MGSTRVQLRKQRRRRREERVAPLPRRTPTSTRPARTLRDIDAALAHQRGQAMSNLRIFWIIWCSMWALGWLLCGFLFIPLRLFVPLSLGAILIPVGSARKQLPPPPWPPEIRGRDGGRS